MRASLFGRHALWRCLHRWELGVCKKGIIAKGDYSGTSEEVSLSKVVGTALDFSLAGGAWVKDPRSNVELAHLASLSASLVHNPANRNVRELIWKANEATRQLMLSCASL